MLSRMIRDVGKKRGPSDADVFTEEGTIDLGLES